jgi:sugar phosphate isomerase/epimerase
MQDLPFILRPKCWATLCHRANSIQLCTFREKAYANFVETVRELSKYAREKNIQLLIENNVVTGELLKQGRKSPLFLADIEDIVRFFADINDPNVGLLLDAGHARVTATSLGLRPESFFEDLSPYVRALHLSDNAGIRDTHQRLHKHVWFAPFLKDFSQYPIVIETSRRDIGENLDQRKVLVELMTGP